MKRTIIIAILLLSLAFCGCSPQLFTAIKKSQSAPMLLPSESKANFEKLEQVLLKTAESYEIELKRVRSEYGDDGIIVDYELKPDADSRLKISLSNLLLDGRKKGEERFSVSYEKSDRAAEFDIELFKALVNSVSGRVLSLEFCDSFLSDTDGTFAEISSNDATGWMHKFKTLDEYGNLSLSMEWLADESEIGNASEVDYTELLYFEGLTSTGSEKQG